MLALTPMYFPELFLSTSYQMLRMVRACLQSLRQLWWLLWLCCIGFLSLA
jgi:hypothetical protein